MVVNIPDSGLHLESSAKAMAGLPMQAFAITLSDSVIEDMIECVQNGQDIQLSLGSSPAFLFDDQEVQIPTSPTSFDYDLFYSNSTTPASVNKLQHPAMSIFRTPKYKPKAPKAPQPTKTEKSDRTTPRALTAKPSSATPKLVAVPDRVIGSIEDDAIANLKNSYAKVEADKRENSSLLVDGIFPSKGGKGKPGKVKLLGTQANTASRSHPGSPALGALASPSLGPTSTPAQDRVKQQRFPIIHELAVQELAFSQIFKKYDEGTEQEFSAALNKVADFDEKLQKWALKKMYWKDLDVFQYNYDPEEDRQRAIDNAIKQYDRMRLGASDPLWQKLLPNAERNKGICLSKLQAAIANKISAAPKINVQKTDVSSMSGGDSEKDDSTSSGAKKAKGGEAMSRSNSQTLPAKKKPSASEAQAKRLLSTSKKPAAAKASPKVSPTKPTATAKAPGAKGGRVLSKEFISDSDSDDDEVPLSSSMPKSKGTPVAGPTRPADRVAEKVKAADKPKEQSAPKAKPAPATRPAAKEKEKDTIRAQVIAKPIKAPAKRQRDAEDDDSSSSGTPLSKRVRPGAKLAASAAGSIKQRAPSDASQNSRATSSGGLSAAKSKNTSPVKSSPLASSPPTNASELEQDRPSAAHDHGRGRERGREHDRDTIVSRAGSSSTDSSASGGALAGKKRSAEDSSPEGRIKRQRLSDEILNKANKFKQFYSRYEALHKEIKALEDPHPDRVADLVDMHERLLKMKTEIYREAPVDA